MNSACLSLSEFVCQAKQKCVQEETWMPCHVCHTRYNPLAESSFVTIRVQIPKVVLHSAELLVTRYQTIHIFFPCGQSDLDHITKRSTTIFSLTTKPQQWPPAQQTLGIKRVKSPVPVDEDDDDKVKKKTKLKLNEKIYISKYYIHWSPTCLRWWSFQKKKSKKKTESQTNIQINATACHKFNAFLLQNQTEPA